jgi:hypothetical protein
MAAMFDFGQRGLQFGGPSGKIEVKAGGGSGIGPRLFLKIETDNPRLTAVAAYAVAIPNSTINKHVAAKPAARSRNMTSILSEEARARAEH